MTAAAILVLGTASGGAYATGALPIGPQHHSQDASARQRAQDEAQLRGRERDDDDDEDLDEEQRQFRDEPGGGGANHVRVINQTDGRFRLEGRADFEKIKGRRVTPSNEAYAESTCVDCQSVAIAFQLIIYKRGADVVAPRNAAIAINSSCTRCLTVARAVQYVVPVDDPDNSPPNVRRLVQGINRELRELERIRTLNQDNVVEVDTRINALLAEFAELRPYVQDYREEKRRGDGDGDDRDNDGRNAPTQATPASPAPAGSPASQPLQASPAAGATSPAPVASASPATNPSTTPTPTPQPAATSTPTR